MSELFLYSIKSALVLTVLYAPYALLMQKESFFCFNRMTLLVVLLLALMLPLCNISPMSLDNLPVIHAAQRQMIEIGFPIMQVIDETSAEVGHHEGISWFRLVSFIYLAVTLLLFVLHTAQLVMMGKRISAGSLWHEYEDRISIYCHADDVAPYSWFGSVVISKSDYDTHGHEIIMHEKGHVCQFHSLDILLLILVETLQWWNPFVYMLGTSLRDVHEYEADAYVLRQGITPSEYQTLLIRKAVGSSSYTFANNFNHSLTIKRITMMCKKQSNPWMRSKVLYVIPVSAVALSVFATPEYASPLHEGTPSADSAMTTLTGKISEAKVTNNFLIFQGDKGEKRVITLNGREIQEEEMKMIPPETIASISIVKKNAKDILGRDCDELIVIETKDYADIKTQDDALDACDKMPQYEGGMNQLFAMISEQVKYPKSAMECGAQGRVIVTFVVEKDGGLSDVNVMSAEISAIKADDELRRAANRDLKQEAIRVVSLSSGKWTPGEQDGQKVRVKYTIPLTFRLK